MTDASAPRPVRILWVFAWLVVGGEETELRLLATNLDPARYRIDVVACFRREGMSEQTHRQLDALGVRVDRTPYGLSFEDTVTYLAGRIPDYDIVMSSQDVRDIYPALERLAHRPPLIEHGGLVAEALAGPKHLTARYVGVCAAIRDAAAGRMAGRPHHAVEIPSMVDVASFAGGDREGARAALGIAAGTPLIGWVGRLDAKKRVQDFIAAAAIVHVACPEARFLVVGGPDAFMPEYAVALRVQADTLGLGAVVSFLGDRDDVPALLSALDVFVWLSRGEGMPHVIAEAGAASLPVVATADNGTLQQIEDGVSGLFVPHECPDAVAGAICRLIADAPLRARLGAALHERVIAHYSARVVVPRWETLLAEVIAEHRPAAAAATLFRSFLQGGFECSTHRRRHDGRRLDLIAATRHDLMAEHDYRLLADHGMLTVREGLRWHRVEAVARHYDWSSVEAQLSAAAATGTQVIWDLLHYGWPDDIDIWGTDFVARFARFAGAAARVIAGRLPGPRFYVPVNEISFLAWGGGEVGYLNPFTHRRGVELKVQLARAAIAAMRAIRAADPAARFVHAEPAIHVACDPDRPEDAGAAEGHRLAQFQAWDMLGGTAWPQLGGSADLLDIVGVNYYSNNQWIHGGPPIGRDHPLHRPFNELLAEIFARYGRPLLIAETGIEGDARAEWLAHVGSEVRIARSRGVQVEGICLYPIIDHPGWDDERYCANGLLSMTDTQVRAVDQSLAKELSRQRLL